MLITKRMLKSLVCYDPETGIFTWLNRSVSLFSHCKNPSRACNSWSSQNSERQILSKFAQKGSHTEYIQIRISICGTQKRYLAHRLAWLYVTGEFPEQVDHEDHNGLNNRWDNLKNVDHQTNSMNSKMYSSNKSGEPCIRWEEDRSKWKVQVRKNGFKSFEKRFDDLSDAVTARDRAWGYFGFHKNHGVK